MKKLILGLFLLFAFSKGFSQSMSCSEVYQIVTENCDYQDVVTPINSTMLAKLTYYTLDGNGFVVARIKADQYDFQGKPYIFCGISSQRWARFKSEGMFGSWGESFHAYIREYTCNCY